MELTIEHACKVHRAVTSAEMRFIKDAVGTVPDKTKAIVNIGVLYGASCTALLVGMHEYDIIGPLFCIDVFKYHNAGGPKVNPFRERTDIPWSDSFLEQTKASISPFVGDKRVHYAQCFSDDFDLSVVDGISLVFIDADHSTHGCLLDILKFSQKVVAGGLMLFHDFGRFPSINKAVRIFTTIRPVFKAIPGLHGT
ncbi:class I SAM-dependent methyltransferase, partial [bacterium]|nr:class I SAM-dependent methyltransferase [bacterium]